MGVIPADFPGNHPVARIDPLDSTDPTLRQFQHMAPGRRKRSAGSRKIRVDFRANRAKPAREKDWTRQAREAGEEELDTLGTERVSGKGDLSRKRTIIAGDADQAVPGEQGMRDGTVVTVYGAVAQVDDGKRVWPCSIRRVLRTRSIRARNVVTVGDRVQFTVLGDRQGVEAEGVIESVKPRRGELKRVVGHREHTVVANVDQAVIVTSAGAPKPKPHLVDRYIVSALHGGIEPVICLNKIDQATPETVEPFVSLYRRLGYKTLATSALTKEGMDKLGEVLAGKASVVAGQSGVGKSSLLNALQPGLNLSIGKVVEDTLKGRHTTARATLLKLDLGGYVVDTPGVKAFDLSCVPAGEFEEHFVEFVDRVPHCKYPNCTHIREDHCAIRGAVERGLIHPDRYESYVRLFTDEQQR